MNVPAPSAPRTRHRSTSRRAVGGIVLGVALAVAAPLAASAHVHVSPEEAGASASTRLTFSFSHGCDDSPTTALVFDIPDGVDGVTPVLDAAWTISRELGADGVADQVTYTAVTPVESGVSASVALDVIFSSSATDTSVAFPIVQQCTVGETAWSEVAEEGQDAHDLEAPAPVVAVGAVAETDEHGHGAGEQPNAAEHETVATTSDDPVARWLSGGALVAAVAALGVALLRRRRA